MRAVARKFVGGLCATAFVFPVSETVAQTVPVVSLRPANAVLHEEFSRLFGSAVVRELADGRLLVAEGGRASRLVVADFQTGVVKAIGAKGQGPGEYTLLFGIYALPSDSTAIIGNDRWLVLSGDRITQTTAGGDVSVSGFDALGQALVMLSGGPFFADSSSLALKSRQRDGMPKTTLAVVRVANFAESGYPPPPERKDGGIFAYNGPWMGKEGAQLFLDGWLAIVRQNPYRVDWRSPDGKWVNGAPLKVPVVAVTNREKQAFMQRMADASGAALKDASSFAVWPKRIPPYTLGMVLVAAPDGKLLIPRTPTADHPEARYDVV
ncbi:MAG: hypothetical protein ABI852_20670, partial [Gemmatimonadaceae bacterium]